MLAVRALGERNIAIRYIDLLNGLSKIDSEAVRKLVRYLKIYSAFNLKGTADRAILLNPIPLGKKINFRFFYRRSFIVDFMDVGLDENMDLVQCERELVEKAAGIIFWSKSLMELLSKKSYIPKHAYIPAGVDSSLIDKIIDSRDYFLKKKSTEEKIVTYFGYLWRINGREVQGVYDLVKAMSIVEKKVNNVRLVLSGVIPDEDFIRVVKKSGIKNLSYLEPVPYGSKSFLNRLHMSDIFVLPTTSHPTIFYAEQHKLFNYMAARKPIVATDTPGTRGVLDDTTAIFAHTESPESLATAIVKILGDYDFGAKIADTAFNRLIEKYTWNKLAQEYSDFILNCFPA